MKRNLWPTRDPVKDYFPLPKEIFSLGLSAAEIAIYAYLLFCDDRQTFQCLSLIHIYALGRSRARASYKTGPLLFAAGRTFYRTFPKKSCRRGF